MARADDKYVSLIYPRVVRTIVYDHSQKTVATLGSVG